MALLAEFELDLSLGSILENRDVLGRELLARKRRNILRLRPLDIFQLCSVLRNNGSTGLSFSLYCSLDFRLLGSLDLGLRNLRTRAHAADFTFVS